MVAFQSCNCEKIEIDAPDCIKDKIEAFKQSDLACDSGASVIRYDFQRQKVFAFNPGNCIADGGANVYTEDCDEICFLGGLMGNLMCNEVEFWKVATNPTVIWEN